MQARGKIKPFAAWILILILTVSLMPVSAMGEAIEEPDEGIRIEVIQDEAAESVTEEITESSKGLFLKGRITALIQVIYLPPKLPEINILSIDSYNKVFS